MGEGEKEGWNLSSIWSRCIELEGAYSDGTSLFSVNHLEIHLGHVFKFDLPEEWPGTLVKNKDCWASLQICPQRNDIGICILTVSQSQSSALKKDSEYKSRLVSGILTGLVYIKNGRKEQKMMKTGTPLP